MCILPESCPLLIRVRNQSELCESLFVGKESLNKEKSFIEQEGNDSLVEQRVVEQERNSTLLRVPVPSTPRRIHNVLSVPFEIRVVRCNRKQPVKTEVARASKNVTMRDGYGVVPPEVVVQGGISLITAETVNL